MAIEIETLLSATDVSDHSFCASESIFFQSLMAPAPAVPKCILIRKDKHWYMLWLMHSGEVCAALDYCLSAVLCLLFSPKQCLIFIVVTSFLLFAPVAIVCSTVTYTAILEPKPLTFGSESLIEFVPEMYNEGIIES